VAEPADLPRHGLPPVDVSGEVAWARAALGDLPTVVLPAPCSGERATLAQLAAAARDVAICWLIGAGVIMGDKPCLRLERPDGASLLVSADMLAAHLGPPARGPLLVVLTTYADDPQSAAAPALEVLGQELARHGIAAVLALTGPHEVTGAEAFIAAFFGALAHDGQIGRALAVAQAQAPASSPPEWPALFLHEDPV
jgi:hypothetical protein